jgi:hypothetical protein
MDQVDPTTIAALVAAVLALAEVVKALGKLAYSKLSKNGDAAAQRTLLETVAAQNSALERQNGLLNASTEMLREMMERQAAMYRWHEPEVEPGVKVWWVRKSLEDAIKDLGSKMEKLASSMQQQVSICGATQKHLGGIERDIEQVKTEVHDMALKDKYKRGGTGSEHFVMGKKSK